MKPTIELFFVHYWHLPLMGIIGLVLLPIFHWPPISSTLPNGGNKPKIFHWLKHSKNR
jgi:hypothetical protein